MFAMAPCMKHLGTNPYLNNQCFHPPSSTVHPHPSLHSQLTASTTTMLQPHDHKAGARWVWPLATVRPARDGSGRSRWRSAPTRHHCIHRPYAEIDKRRSKRRALVDGAEHCAPRNAVAFATLRFNRIPFHCGTGFSCPLNIGISLCL